MKDWVNILVLATLIFIVLAFATNLVIGVHK